MRDEKTEGTSSKATATLAAPFPAKTLLTRAPRPLLLDLPPRILLAGKRKVSLASVCPWRLGGVWGVVLKHWGEGGITSQKEWSSLVPVLHSPPFTPAFSGGSRMTGLRKAQRF